MRDEAIAPQLMSEQMPDAHPAAGWACEVWTSGGGRHPWFVLSGLLMLVGCYLINAAAHGRPDELAPVLWLVLVFNGYQFAALGVAAWLIRRHGRPTFESRQLLVIVAFLLADTTLIYQELTTAAPGFGGALGGLAIGTGLLQLWIIGRALGVALPWAGWVAVGVNLVLVFVMPLMLRLAGSSGRVNEGAVYILWWLIAGAVGVSVLAWVRAGRLSVGRRWVEGAIAVTLGSVVLHALSLHWVYRLEVVPLHLSPMLLVVSGLGLHLAATAEKRALAWVISGLGVCFAGFGYAAGFYWKVGPVEFTPHRYWLLAAAGAYGVIGWRHRRLGTSVAAGVALGAACLGPTFAVMLIRLREAIDTAIGWAQLLGRGSLMQWGVGLIVAAFVTLGLGAWWSGHRSRRV